MFSAALHLEAKLYIFIEKPNFSAHQGREIGLCHSIEFFK